MNTGIKNENVFNRVVGNMDVVAAFGILGIIAMIVIPISTGLLDILLTFNITFSIIILLLTLFTTDVLQFSVFPTLLLVTTLFRLGLNAVSYTHLDVYKRQISQDELPEDRMETPFSALIPAFVISELKTAFQIGFILYIPFIVIDMVVASILMSMGMFMLPPVTISLPFKLCLLYTSRCV